ncbi:MAG: HAMP domain-containing sensor histidine kinase [Patescibacteria group bacterium]
MSESKNNGNLHRRFVMRVLAPPFVALLLLSAATIWQLGNILHRQAIDGLKRSATTTAATLEREFALRETILKQSGTELFVIKSEYNSDRKQLDDNRDACRAHMQKKFTFKDAPNGVCEPFRGGFAGSNTGNLASLENEYVLLGEEMIQDQNQRINERISAFKQFFPETLALLIINDKKQPVSSAYSGIFKASTNIFQPDAESALVGSIRGKLATAEGYQLAVFAFQIPGGSVLAAYDLQNENFIRQVWESAPIDRTRTLALLLDSTGSPAYPILKDADGFKTSINELHHEPYINIPLDNVDHTVVGAPAGSSNWSVAIASPTAAVLATLRDAQLAAVVVIGLFMVGFVWVGTFFIQRTLRNIVSLVSGAMVFGSGRLDYKIALDHADGEFVRLAETMNAMAQRIFDVEKSVDEKNKEFISVATHELRAPLTAIIGHLSMFNEMYDKKLDDKAKFLIDQAYYGSARLRDLVNDMLNVARLESGRSEFALTTVPIKPVVEDVISTMAVVAKITNVTLEYKHVHEADVLADEQRLRIIINNFVSNAIKYNRPGGHVIVSHQVQDNLLVTCIEDNGLGIPEDQKAHMFEKFFRVEHEDRKSVTGTGLGMYITKEYIEQMHGKLWFESSHGTGTKFYFSLPIVSPPLRTKIKKIIKQKLARK